MEADVDPLALTAGQLLEGFEIIRFLASGGSSAIYLARDLKLGRRVAIKTVITAGTSSRDVIERFLLEARATAKFSHPNIVTVYAVGESGGLPWVAFEYVEGQTLRQRLLVERPAMREALRIGVALAEAVTEAHRNGVLHLDLKPENAIFGRDGRLRVLDFGLAYLSQVTVVEAGAELEPSEDDEHTGAEPGNVCGTPPYMAPEQWQGAPEPASDVWALGVILHELLLGVHPYEGDLMTLFIAVTSPEPVPLRDSPRLPSTVTEILVRCLNKQANERPSAQEVLEALHAALGERAARRSDANPFCGLLSFDERQADVFFGRDAEIEAAVERLRRQPLLPLVGVSGAGKSSFVRAGLVPRLRDQAAWELVATRPGSTPFLHLAEALESARTMPTLERKEGEWNVSGLRATPATREDVVLLATALTEAPALLGQLLRLRCANQPGRSLLFVDQLEEVLTLVEDPSVRVGFLRALCLAGDDPRGPVRVVVTAREDFLSRLAEVPEMAEQLGEVMVVRSPGADALRDILTRPLRVVGYEYEDSAMVEEMLSAVRHDGAALPLLQFTLALLWERRDPGRRLLTRTAYTDIGGVAGALVAHAEDVLAGLSDAQRSIARGLLLRLVTPARTRRVLTRAELLAGLGDDAAKVLDSFTSARLVVARRTRGDDGSGAELELAHEALIRSWSRLTRWLDESRDEHVALAEIDQAAALWHKRGERDSEVWEGAAVVDARRRLGVSATQLPELHRRFFAASERRAKRSLRRKRLALSLGFIALSVVAVVSLLQRRQTEAEKLRAEQSRSDAQREGARSSLARGEVLEARAQLRESIEGRDSVAARALWQRLAREPLVWRRQVGTQLEHMTYSPDGKLVAVTCDDRSVYLFDAQTATTRVLRGHRGPTFDVAFSPDSRTLLVAANTTIHLWDLEREERREVEDAGRVMKVRFLRDGRGFASVTDTGTARLWAVDSLAMVAETRVEAANYALAVQQPSGAVIAFAGTDHLIRLWQPGTGEIQVLRGHEGTVPDLDFDPSGATLASTSADETVRLWDVAKATQRAAWRSQSGGPSIQYSPSGAQLAVAGLDGRVRIYDASDGRLVRTIVARDAVTIDVAFSPDGSLLADAGFDGTVNLWRLDVAESAAAGGGHVRSIRALAFSPRGERVASAGVDSSVRVWNVETGASEAVFTGHKTAIESVVFDASGARLASGSWDEAKLWDLSTKHEVGPLPKIPGGAVGVAFSPAGKLLAIDNGVGSAYFVGLDTLKTAFSFVAHRDARHYARAVFGGAGGRYYVSSMSNDSRVRVFDMERAAVERPDLALELGDVRTIASSVDGRMLATWTGGGNVRQWRFEGHPEVVLERQINAPRAALNASPLMVATHGEDRRRLAVVDLVTDQRFEVTERTPIVRAALSKDGRYVVTGTDSGSVRVWDRLLRQPLWRGVALLPGGVAFSHRGWTDARGAITGPRTALARRIESARTTSLSDDSQRLCLFDGQRVEEWGVETDKRLGVEHTEDLFDLQAANGGCAMLTRAGTALLRAGTRHLLVEGATHLSVQADEIFSIAPRRVVIHRAADLPTRERVVSDGVTVAHFNGDALVTGYLDGGVEMAAAGNAQKILFEEIPPSAVTRIIDGPRGTLVVGFGDGFVGLWDPSRGALLDSTRVHGAITHLRLERGVLTALSELGERVTLELTAFESSYCEVVRRVWRDVPVSYATGSARRQAAPSQHLCAQ